MGESRNERSSKRQGTTRGVNKASSDSELAQSKDRGRRSKPKEKWPLLEGLTVDELARYRRRRANAMPKDNLGLDPDAEFEDFVSEYREAFRAKSEEFLKESTWLEPKKRSRNLQLKDAVETKAFLDEDNKEVDKTHTELQNKNKEAGISSGQVDDVKSIKAETMSSNITTYTHPTRPSLIRRGTTLKYDGELYADTETYTSYVAHEGNHKPQLARRPTSLKMEGNLDTTTEKCEKFIQWLNVSRPELMRVATNLKLEGELDTRTESHEKYVPFVGVRRPELLRQNTNLKLEGESNFVPEYTDVFKRYENKERQKHTKSETHPKADKTILLNTLTATNSHIKEVQLMNESNKNVEAEKGPKNRNEKKQNDGEMKTLISKLDGLNGPPLEIPEYKDAYKDFPRERPRTVKPEDELTRADGLKMCSSPTPKFSRRIDQDPEYKSKYLDCQRSYPVHRKPPLNLRTPSTLSEYSTRFDRQGSNRQDHEFISEVRSQYVPYGRVSRVETLKMPTNLRLEGNLDLEPEYRTAYCTKHEMQLHAEPKVHRRRDRSLSASRQKGNYWVNNNAEQFGYRNAAEEQDAFQVLDTKVHEEIVCNKPPTCDQRVSKSIQSQTRRQSQLDMTESNMLKETSTNPTFRLQVCNVDAEPKVFKCSQSPLHQSSGRMRNPSPDRALQSNIVRPYSPSFAKALKKHNNGQSFVVLDNKISDPNKNDIRKRHAAYNYNIDHSSLISKERNRNPTNWMPPWYDNTNTI